MKTVNQLHLQIVLSLFCLLMGCKQEPRSLTIADRVDVVSFLAREPMFAEHPSGDLYLTGYRNNSEEPQLWKSIDKGKTWKLVNVGDISAGADGNSDVDLAIDREGVIYFMVMKFTRIPEDTTGFKWSEMKGEHIAMGVSSDKGNTWRWTFLSKNDYDDRPWVEVGSDGSVHAIWNDGKGIHYSKSDDHGKTWTKQEDISAEGGSSHFAAGPDRQLAVRVSPASASGAVFDERIDMIRISTDLGNTWKDVKPPGTRAWNQEVPRWVEPLAWSNDNELYYLWSGNKRLMLGIYSLENEQWRTHVVEESDKTIYYPYLSVKGNLISCTWVSGIGDDLRHHAAVLQLENDKLIVSVLSPPLELDIRARFRSDRRLATGGEYFPIIPLSDGAFGMVTSIQNHAEGRLGFTWWRLSFE